MHGLRRRSPRFFQHPFAAQLGVGYLFGRDVFPAGTPSDPSILRWASWPGHTYSVWRTAALMEGFAEIASGIEGSGATIEFADPSAHQHKAAFYQLKIRAEE